MIGSRVDDNYGIGGASRNAAISQGGAARRSAGLARKRTEESRRIDDDHDDKVSGLPEMQGTHGA